MNFDGPVRVAKEVGTGTGAITLSFDAWKGATVAPTTHSVTVLPPKPGPKLEPIAPNLIASLIHADRKAVIHSALFSSDGTQLFTAGYPSGIVQIWDVAKRQEIRRIATPPGRRGSADYAKLTPDWKTLYVPVQKRTVTPFERDGKRFYRIDYSGSIHVWDVVTGAEQASLVPPAGSGPVYAALSPDGRHLVCVEQPSIDNAENRPATVTAIWDLATGKRRHLCDGYVIPSFSPDGKWVAVNAGDREVGGASAVKLLDLTTGTEHAAVKLAEKERFFSVGPFSPDGAVVAVYLGGKKGGPAEIWFLDGRTLAGRGKLVGKADPSGYGWIPGAFAPDGKRFIALDALDGVGNVVIWNLAKHAVERTVGYDGERSHKLAISPDSRTAAVAWTPPRDKELEFAIDPDPHDLPQPRVTLIDLAGNAPLRMLIAPHGYVGALAFSPDGTLLAFGGAGATHLFDLRK